jgi:hypothetical protein
MSFNDAVSSRLQDVMIWRLKAEIVEPQETSIHRQRLRKPVPAGTGTYVTIEVSLETVFSIRSVQRVIKEESWGLAGECWVQLSSAREAEERWRYSSVEGIAGSWDWDIW